jgi:hypothetical protein
MVTRVTTTPTTTTFTTNTTTTTTAAAAAAAAAAETTTHLSRRNLCQYLSAKQQQRITGRVWGRRSLRHRHVSFDVRCS